MTTRLLARLTATAALGFCAWAAPAGASGHARHHPASARVGGAQSLAARNAGVKATLAYAQIIETAAVGLVTDLRALSAALATGDLAGAKADELAAQGRYDAMRFVVGPGPTAGSAIDGLAADVPAGQQFAGLHLIEQELWDGGNARPAVSALLAKAPLIELSFTRLQDSPEAIVTDAMKELGWVNEVAIPGGEELYSHFDAVDAEATVDAAHDALVDVAPLARFVEPRRLATVSRLFSVLLRSVAALGPPGAEPDSNVPPAEWEALAQDDDAAASALGAMAATLAGYGPRQIYGYNA